MHFCIAQFNSENGARMNNHFKLDENRGRYKKYLGSLEDWRGEEDQMRVVADYQVSLYTAARYVFSSYGFSYILITVPQRILQNRGRGCGRRRGSAYRILR
jgi:hypothetical protein